MGRKSQKAGKRGEAHALAAFSRLGIEMPEEVATPVILVKSARDPRAFIVRYRSRVNGDIRGIIPGLGRRVVAEAKWHPKERFQYSIMTKHGEHQIAWLDRNRELGGISLLVWVRNEYEVAPLVWKPEPLVPRASLAWAWAWDHSVMEMRVKGRKVWAFLRNGAHIEV